MNKNSEKNKITTDYTYYVYTPTCDLTFTGPYNGVDYIKDYFSKSTKPSNPYIPLKVYCNSENKTTIVKWNDGTETKVTCDKEDNFSPESGYFAALAVKVFGNDKKKFKDFWYPVISRKIVLDGKRAKPIAYGKWEKQRMESNGRKKKCEGSTASTKSLSTKSRK